MSAPFARLTFVTLVLLAPGVVASSPVPALPSAFSLGGQDVTDLSMDPSGEFVVGVVTVDPAGSLQLPGQPRKDDIYPCHFGPPSSAGTGSGCRNPGWQHNPTFRTAGGPQVVDYTSYASQSGLVARFAVGGPVDTLSLWSNIQDVPIWEVAVTGSQNVLNVSLAPDASRVVVGTAPTSSSGTGRFLMYNASRQPGALLWEWPLEDSRPTSIDYARAGTVVAVGTASATGTTSGWLYFFKPKDAKPVTNTDLFRISAGSGTSGVTQVLFSRDATALVAGTTQGVWYIPVDPVTARPADSRSFTSLSGGAQRVALSLDGERFAAASGSRIHFFKHENNTFVASRVGTEYDVGAPITDLAYDAKGDILVAIAGNRVYGFGPHTDPDGRNTPIWSFDATDPSNGGLDGPLRKVVVSDGGERIVIAGKTRLAPYRSVIAAAGTFLQTQRMDVQPATTVKLSLSVTNKGSLWDNYTFSARFPVGWSGFAPENVRLDPEETATVNMTVDVPAGQAPGFFGVEVDVRSEALIRLGRSNVVVATPMLNLTVPRSVVLNLTTSDERVPALRQGGEITVPVTLRNRGNAEGVVNLSVTQRLSRGAPWSVRFLQEQVNIASGAEMTVNLLVSAPIDAGSGDRNDITLCAREGQPKTCQKDGSVNEAVRTITAYVDPRFGAELTTNATAFEFGQGDLRVITVNILNTGNTDDSYNITALITPIGVSNDWRVTLERDFITIPRGEKRSVAVTVRAAVTDPREASLVIRAISIGSTLTEDSTLTVSLVPRPITTTPDDRSFLPAPGVLTALALLALVAMARRRSSR